MTQPRKTKSPTLDITITDEDLATAIQSNSGGCLIADAIKRQYPSLSGVTVDMATIRVSDKAKRERYTYLTPPSAQHILLSFDQGWPLPTQTLRIKRAVHVQPLRIDYSSPSKLEREERSRTRLDELTKKSLQGETLTSTERQTLTRLSRYWDDRKSAPKRVSNPSEARQVGFVEGHVVVRDGKPPATGANHPNLLRGRNRHFGAKLADPGVAFTNAVEAAVAQRLSQDEGNR